MKESPILEIPKPFIDLLVPHHASPGTAYVHEFEPESVAYEVVGEHDGAAKTRVRPFCWVGVSDIQFRDGDGVDFVSCFGNQAFDCLFLVVG